MKAEWACIERDKYGHRVMVAVINGYLVRLDGTDTADFPKPNTPAWSLRANKHDHEWGADFTGYTLRRMKAVAVRRAHGDESDPVEARRRSRS
jgi:hypothetical protein